MNWLFGAHSLWRDTLLSIGTGEEDLGDLGDFVDSPWEAVPSLKSEGKGRSVGKKRRERELERV